MNDVSNIDDISKAFDHITAGFGQKTDVLIVNAGNFLGAPLADFTEELFDQTVNVNFKGVFFTVQRALPYLNDGPVVVITDYLFPALRETLRKAGIGYMDVVGNIYLKVKGQLIFVDGKQPDKKEKSMQIKNRAFTKTGLPLVFDILQNDDWLNKTHRELAALYKMALGNVHNIFKNLLDGDYLLQTGNNRNRQYQFLNKKKLLEEWIIAYAETLKPALYIAGFRFLKDDGSDEWKKVALNKGKTFWGSEPAGDLLTNYLKPAIFTWYTTEEKNELVRNYRLVPDTNGNIAVYNKFWHYNEDNKNITAPPLLVYADLINTGDARCVETAQRVYDGSLKDKF